VTLVCLQGWKGFVELISNARNSRDHWLYKQAMGLSKEKENNEAIQIAKYESSSSPAQVQLCCRDLCCREGVSTNAALVARILAGETD
jgi:hypothetical protein